MVMQVVGGLIVGRVQGEPVVLLTQRDLEQDYGGLWESPGGKVRTTEDCARRALLSPFLPASHPETPQEALARELLEEIGVEVPLVRYPDAIDPEPVFATDLAREDGTPLRWSLYVVRRSSGTPYAREQQRGIGWYTVEEMLCLRKTPGNTAAAVVVAAIMRARTTTP